MRELLMNMWGFSVKDGATVNGIFNIPIDINKLYFISIHDLTRN